MKLSIITTVYQAENDLPRLLDSMITNTSVDLEFFLIINGATDSSELICQEYAKKDSRFHIHTLKENIGYIRARNLGLKLVDADYIGFCDSDDFVAKGAYDIIIEKLQKSECDLLIGGWNTINNNDIKTSLPPFKCRIYSGKKDINKIMPQFFGKHGEYRVLDGFMWKQFFKLSIIRENGICFQESLKPYEDMLLNAEYIKFCNIVEVTDIIIYNYIVNSKSITAEIIKDFNIKEESLRIIGLISALRKICNNTQSQIAIANHGLTLFTTMLSFSANTNKSSQEISTQIHNSISSDFILYISQQSKPKEISYKFIKWCLRLGLLNFLIMTFKLKNCKL